MRIVLFCYKLLQLLYLASRGGRSRHINRLDVLVEEFAHVRGILLRVALIWFLLSEIGEVSLILRLLINPASFDALLILLLIIMAKHVQVGHLVAHWACHIGIRQQTVVYWIIRNIFF